ncbi:aminopeptidase P family protein [Fulvivirgaceae bacterium BMA10]|uniref:Xaa-Pro aminopeptidase n=1 Tax=Splendidivirga corallicola TaxID=3051826 RepID=A0ABT8KRT6_9BACT|nr:aminopeptidase P family protein [Fulvivirgaceae bacterium BMA10]
MTILILFMGLGFSFSQELNEPDDFLKKEFHQDRRQKFREKMPENSVAIFFANAIRNRSNDVDYVYHQDPDFYYLTGYREPHAVLLIFSDDQTDVDGNSYNEIIFVQPRNARMEQWLGKRLGPAGVKAQLGFVQVFANNEFQKHNIDFGSFDKVLYKEFHNDVRDNQHDQGDLYSLIEQFKSKANYPDGYERGVKINVETNETKEKQRNLDNRTLVSIMTDLRGIKTKEELTLLRKAVNISTVAQVEVMKAMTPDMSETEIQGMHEYVFKKYGSEYEGYPSIVGAGHNGCVLHYINNSKPKVGNNLVLMDLGAEYHGYTADVTRTIPANGKFSKEQKQIYDLVYKAQDEAIKMCRVGTTFRDVTMAARKIIAEGLKELGIIENQTDAFLYFPHGLSHHIGLDVHDRGHYNVMQENMVITVEPGIYIPEDSKCDKKWWGIAVRIEDCILITDGEPELLSNIAPRKSDKIEAMMSKQSPLNQLKLPNIDE